MAKSGLLQAHVQFGVESDFVWYENEVKIIEGIHLLNVSMKTVSKVFTNHPKKTTYQ
jgi:hypothetical protein